MRGSQQESNLLPSELEPVLISALNEYVFCPRRCALKFIEGHWGDNEHTSLGTLLHDHADQPGYETDAGVTMLRALPLFSLRYGLVGKADIVEVREGNFELRIADFEMTQGPDTRESQIVNGGANRGTENLGLGISDCGSKEPSKSEVSSPPNPAKSAIRNSQSEIHRKQYAPVEYKKGRRRKFENDDVQLCAQAFCLEEMFSTTVPEGFIYHAASKRRRKVIFDEGLRAETEQAIEAVRTLLAKGEVPPAVLLPRCDGCSLRSVCLPELTQIKARFELDHYGRSLWT